MKHMKKLLAMLMVLCMLVPLFGLSALAVDKMTNDPGSTKQWGMKAVGMEEAWRSGLTGKGVKVGVIDCGLSTSTGDIARSRVEAGPNYTGSIGDSATDIEVTAPSSPVSSALRRTTASASRAWRPSAASTS